MKKERLEKERTEKEKVENVEELRDNFNCTCVDCKKNIYKKWYMI